VTSGTDDKFYNNYYVAEYRTYKGYDATLKTGRTTSATRTTRSCSTGWTTSRIRTGS